MQVGRTLVHPELARDDMPDRVVALRDGDHLRVAGRARREVDHHQLVGWVVRIGQIGRGIGHQVFVAVIASVILSNDYDLAQVGALIARRLDLW